MEPITRKNFTEKSSLYAHNQALRNKETGRKIYLAHGTGAKKHRERRLAFQSTLDDAQFGFPGQKAGETCNRVLDAQPGNIALFSDLLACFLEETL